MNRDVFKALSNIYKRPCYRLKAVILAKRSILDVWQGFEYASDEHLL